MNRTALACILRRLRTVQLRHTNRGSRSLGRPKLSPILRTPAQPRLYEATAALGEPTRDSIAFGGFLISPFGGAADVSEVVSLGEGGRARREIRRACYGRSGESVWYRSVGVWQFRSSDSGASTTTTPI